MEERAHRVGRILHAISDPRLTTAVANDVSAKIAAIEQAELGDLTGRAAQVTALSRVGASPVQVEAADHILHSQPLGCEELFTAVDPSSAAVAAVHWLWAAAKVVSKACGLPASQVVVASDDIGSLPYETPTFVLNLLEAGVSPYDVVAGLVQEAMVIAEGHMPDPAGLMERIAGMRKAVQLHESDPEAVESLLASMCVTALDPMRPAPDLLEDLLFGIGSCAALFHKYADELREEVGGPIKPPETDPEEDETGWDAFTAKVDERFISLVRDEAGNHRDRLL